MKKILILILSVFSFWAMAQKGDNTDGQVSLDLLRAPSSPAANLLGIATTDIDKPTDISSLMVSIQSATNSYTEFPSNFALDFAPFLLFSKEDFTTEGLKSTKFGDVFKQTFVISTAISNPDTADSFLNENSTYSAFGFKFSVFRGKYNTPTTEKLDAIITLQKELNQMTTDRIVNFLKNNHEEYKRLEKERRELFRGKTDEEMIQAKNSEEYKRISGEMEAILNEVINEGDEEIHLAIEKEVKEEIQETASDFQLERVGFFWDINGGLSLEFRDRNFNDSKVYNAGIWTNFGYVTESGFSFLGLTRYLYNPDLIFALDNVLNELDDVSTFDAGVKIAYAKPQSKFGLSAEAIYRNVLSGTDTESSWKMVFNADYAIFENQKLIFSFGRDFDGNLNKDGNLIAALTFLVGFGNKR